MLSPTPASFVSKPASSSRSFGYQTSKSSYSGPTRMTIVLFASDMGPPPDLWRRRGGVGGLHRETRPLPLREAAGKIDHVRKSTRAEHTRTDRGARCHSQARGANRPRS